MLYIFLRSPLFLTKTLITLQIGDAPVLPAGMTGATLHLKVC